MFLSSVSSPFLFVALQRAEMSCTSARWSWTTRKWASAPKMPRHCGRENWQPPAERRSCRTRRRCTALSAKVNHVCAGKSEEWEVKAWLLIQWTRGVLNDHMQWWFQGRGQGGTGPSCHPIGPWGSPVPINMTICWSFFSLSFLLAAFLAPDWDKSLIRHWPCVIFIFVFRYSKEQAWGGLAAPFPSAPAA